MGNRAEVKLRVNSKGNRFRRTSRERWVSAAARRFGRSRTVEKFLHVHPPFAFVVDARADRGGRQRGLNLEAVPVSGGEEAGSLVALTGRSQRPVHLRRADVIQARPVCDLSANGRFFADTVDKVGD